MVITATPSAIACMTPDTERDPHLCLNLRCLTNDRSAKGRASVRIPLIFSLRRSALQAVARGQRKMGGSAEDDALLQRKRMRVLVGVDELVTLVGRQAAHVADGAVDRLAAVGRQLFELVKELAAAFLLLRGQVLPGFHAVQDAFLLLSGQAGKVLQSLLQTGLLLRREPAELRIRFESAALLHGRQITVLAQPVSGMAGLVLRTRLTGRLPRTRWLLMRLLRVRLGV